MTHPIELLRRSATTTASPSARETMEVAKLIDVSACTGCKACQAACMEWHDIRPEVGKNVGVYDNPPKLSEHAWTVVRFAEVEENGRLQWLIRKDGCMHCDEPGCMKSCPAPGAIIKQENGAVRFEHENCTGCGYCVTGCPFGVPKLSPRDSKAYKCDFCSDRLAVNQTPACVKSCPTGALQFGSKAAMKDYADRRVRDLKERGFQNAGLYDPQGVGGTHVMYVLHHADRPELYSGLPKDPSISPAVSVWKGFAKPAAIAGMGLLALGALFHYVTKGPNEVSKETEKEVEKENHQ